MVEWFDLIDKSSWRPGPWQTEPDCVLWTSDETGFSCLIQRIEVHGGLCGYVGLDAETSWYGKHHDKIQESIPSLSVHGMLTFAGEGIGWPEELRTNNLWLVLIARTQEMLCLL